MKRAVVARTSSRVENRDHTVCNSARTVGTDAGRRENLRLQQGSADSGQSVPYGSIARRAKAKRRVVNHKGMVSPDPSPRIFQEQPRARQKAALKGVKRPSNRALGFSKER